MRMRGAIAPLAAWVMSTSCQEVAAPSPAPVSLTMSARVSIYNRTREMHRLEVLSLRQDLELDCARLELDPASVLGADAFVWPDRAAFVELFPGQEVSIDPQDWASRFFGAPRLCGAVRILGDGIPDVLAWWGAGDQWRTFTVDLDAPEALLPRGPSLVLEASYEGEAPRIWRAVVCPEHAWPGACDEGDREEAAVRPDGARYRWEAAGPSRHVAFERTRVGVSRRDDERRLTWTQTSSTYVYDEVREDAGGCVTFWNDGGEADFQVCGAPELFRGLEPNPGEDGILSTSSPFSPGLSGDLIRIDAQRMVGSELKRSMMLLARVVGDRVDSQAMRWTPHELGDGAVQESTCAQRFESIALDVEWGSDFSRRMSAGDQLQSGSKRAYLLRAERGLTRSVVCEPWRRFDTSESLLVEFATREELL